MWPFRTREFEPDTKVRLIIAHVLLWARSFDTPEDAADAMLKRLDLEGYRIVPKE